MPPTLCNHAEKLEDISWTDLVGWEETQAVTHEDPTQVEDVDDDIARELAFYNQVIASTHNCLLCVLACCPVACLHVLLSCMPQPIYSHAQVQF